MSHFRSRVAFPFLVVVLLLAGFAAVPVTGNSTSVATAASPTPAFGPTTIFEHQRLGGEPDIKTCGPDLGYQPTAGTPPTVAKWSYNNCGQSNSYGSFPFGFSTTSSYISRSEDQGQSYKLIPSNNTDGKPLMNQCPGGGDTDLTLTPGATPTNPAVNTDYLTFADLQALTNFSVGTSSDGGTTFPCSPLSTLATGVDRQWFGVYGDPHNAPATPPVVTPPAVPTCPTTGCVYLDTDVVNGADPTNVYHTNTPCASQSTAVGNAFTVSRSRDGGKTYDQLVTADCNDGISGNIQVDQNTGHLFAIHTAYSSTTQTTPDAVVVNVSKDSGNTFTKSVVYSSNGSASTGSDFAVLAIDRGTPIAPGSSTMDPTKPQGLYAVWSQAPIDSTGAITGPSHIFYSYSSNEGASWTPEQQVDHGTTDVNLFPWIEAGDQGRIDVVWYGTTKAAGVSSYDPGSQQSTWYPYFSQSLNAAGTGATFTAPVPVAQHPNHYGGICTMGIGCTTGGDRSLADFFQIAINKGGGTDVIWADTSNNGASDSSGNAGAIIETARQIGGASLLVNGTVSGPTPVTCRVLSTTPCITDRTGDARYEHMGTILPNNPKMDITGSSVGIDPSNAKFLDVRMNIADLSALPSATDANFGPDDNFIDYLTTWNYHSPSGTDATFDSTGNVYYAYLEVNKVSGAIGTAFAGNTCTLNTSKPKFLVYPGQNNLNSTSSTNPTGYYTVNAGTKTIDLHVPLSAVGNPAIGDTLYSVTALSVGQPGSANTGDNTNPCPRTNGQVSDPGGQLFNVYDKSPAYTAVLTSPGATAALLSHVRAMRQGATATFRWQIAANRHPLGFNILVKHAGQFQQINHGLIAAHARRTYAYRANALGATRFYVEAVTRANSTRYGPYTIGR